jgi:hypothetical protein
MISGNERGVAELLADAYAATMEATANVAIISMLDAMSLSKVSVDSSLTSGRKLWSSVASMRSARKTVAMDSAHTISGLIHRRSRKRLMTKLS